MARISSGGGVMLVALCQLVIGAVLLGLFEGYKVYRINYVEGIIEQYEAAAANKTAPAAPKGSAAGQAPIDPNFLRAQTVITSTSPMGVVWWISIFSNVFALCGLAGVINAQRDLVVAFFAYNAVAMVAGLHFFVDIIVDSTVRYGGEPPGTTSYEKATAFFLFFLVLLAMCASALAMRAVDEIKLKQREAYHRSVPLSTLNDTLEFEPDHP